VFSEEYRAGLGRNSRRAIFASCALVLVRWIDSASCFHMLCGERVLTHNVEVLTHRSASAEHRALMYNRFTSVELL
jgi:hypothetical protein